MIFLTPTSDFESALTRLRIDMSAVLAVFFKVSSFGQHFCYRLLPQKGIQLKCIAERLTEKTVMGPMTISRAFDPLNKAIEESS